MREHDMAAAKLLKREIRRVCKWCDGAHTDPIEATQCSNCGRKTRSYPSFTLANPEDLLAVMKVLMREHGWCLAYLGSKWSFDVFNKNVSAPTLQECVGLACVECVGGEE